MGSKKSKQPLNRIPRQCCEMIVCDCPPQHAKIYNYDYQTVPSVPSDCSDTEQGRYNDLIDRERFCRERERERRCRERERQCRERDLERESRERYEPRNDSRSSSRHRHSPCSRHCSDDERRVRFHTPPHQQHYHHYQPQQERCPNERYRTYYAEYNDLMSEAKRKLDSVTYSRLPSREKRLSCSSISSIESF